MSKFQSVHINETDSCKTWNPPHPPNRQEGVGVSLIINTDVANPAAPCHIIKLWDNTPAMPHDIRCPLLLSSHTEVEVLGFSEALPLDTAAVSQSLNIPSERTLFPNHEFPIPQSL